MSIFSVMKEAIGRMIPYKEAYQAFGLESPISSEMQNALIEWQAMYQKNPPWLDSKTKTMNLSALVCSRVAKKVTLEAKYTITGTDTAEDGTTVPNERSEYLQKEAEARLFGKLRQKIEVAAAAGGVVMKPYPVNGHFYFSFCYDWDLYPVAFDGDGFLTDVIFPDRFQRDKTYYTRLERHTLDGANAKIENRAYRSTNPNALGNRCSLSEVDQWAALPETATIKNAGGMLFGWYKTANANTIDLNSPLGAAVFDKAVDVIQQADEKFYSGLLWEFESGERAVHVDENALKPKTKTIVNDAGQRITIETSERVSRLSDRLYRRVPGIQKGDTTDLFEVFSPPFRETSYLNSLNQLKMQIEDLCELSRGTISDANEQARTATELRIVKEETYSTIADNQKNLEAALSDTIRAMDIYATLYNMAPAGEYAFSVDWGDSIDERDQEMSRRLLLMNAGVMGKAEVRAWYTGETEQQAAAAIAAIREESAAEQPINYPGLNEPVV